MRRMWTALAVVALTAGLCLVPATTSAAPTLTCDPTGDGSWNDCIRHRHHGELADHVLKGAEQITVRSRVHPALEGAELDTEIQIRPIEEDGTAAGAWRTVETYTWTADAGEAKHAKSTGSCAAPKPGLYEVRKRVTVPKSHHGAIATTGLRAGDVVATSAPTAFYSNGNNCENTDYDETNVEYFNLINYMQDIEVSVKTEPTDGSLFNVTITCPERESTSIPSSGFTVTMQTTTGTLQTDCYSSTPITLAQSDPDCSADGYCDFVISAVDTTAGKTYSETAFRMQLRNDLVTIPELLPATLPICQTSLAPCLISDDCDLAQSRDATLSLTDPNPS